MFKSLFSTIEHSENQFPSLWAFFYVGWKSSRSIRNSTIYSFVFHTFRQFEVIDRSSSRNIRVFGEERIRKFWQSENTFVGKYYYRFATSAMIFRFGLEHIFESEISAPNKFGRVTFWGMKWMGFIWFWFFYFPISNQVGEMRNRTCIQSNIFQYGFFGNRTFRKSISFLLSLFLFQC